MGAWGRVWVLDTLRGPKWGPKAVIYTSKIDDAIAVPFIWECPRSGHTRLALGNAKIITLHTLGFHRRLPIQLTDAYNFGIASIGIDQSKCLLYVSLSVIFRRLMEMKTATLLYSIN